MRSERGMVLLLSLVAVVILSGLGFSAVQQTRLTSVWVRNTMDVGLARLAAQRAIKAELAVLHTLPISSFTAQGDVELYRLEVFTAPPVWMRAATWRAGRCRPVTATLADTVLPACTIVELLHRRDSPDYRAFRITARGVGTRPETVIFLQAYSVLETRR